MAAKYKNEFYDYCGLLCTVEIYESGFTGATTAIKGSDNPCTIRYLGEGDDKFVHMKASEAVLEWKPTVELQFLSLFLGANKDYLVKIYRGVDPIWYGWINPEYYSEPFLPIEMSPTTTITATDGLALLKNIRFPIPSYTTFQQTMISYVATCLSQIGLDSNMTIRVGLDLTINASPATLTDRHLEGMYIDWRSFTDDEGNMPYCYDVLNEILSFLNARLYQYADSWYIERVDMKHTTHNYNVYSMAGGYNSTVSSFDPVVQLTAHSGRGSDIRFFPDTNLEVQPAARYFTIKQKYGRRDNLLNFTNYAGKFIADEFNGGLLRYWTPHFVDTPTVTYESQWDAVRLNGYFADSSGLPGAYLNSNTIDLAEQGAYINTLMTEWAAGNVMMCVEFNVGAEQPALMYGQLRMEFSGRLSTLQENTAWAAESDATLKSYASTSTYYTYSQYLDQSQWRRCKYIVRQPPADEIGVTQTSITLFARMYQGILGAGSTTGGLMYKDFRVWFEDQLKTNSQDPFGNDEVIKKEYEREIITTISDDNLLTPDEYEINYGNTPPFIDNNVAPPDSVGGGLLYKKIVFDSTGADIHYNAGADYIDAKIVSDLNVTYRRPLFLLKGTVIDTTYTADNLGIGFREVIKDYNQRYYICTGAEYSMRHSTWSGEWLQIWDDATGEFNDDFSDDFFI